MNRRVAIEKWAKSVELGSAAVFIGAGLSQRAGYPSWRQLLRDVAGELGLDIDEEHDLSAVAQYSVNRAVGKRNQLAQLLLSEFPPTQRAPEPFNILARLPIRHIWTTNYDTLVEAAWKNAKRLLDVKSLNGDIGRENPWAHAILYKMHGSIDHPDNVVIAKDDYELYRAIRPAFYQVLAGHIASKQFLFLGFGFSDPNIAHLFAGLREALRDSGPEHFAIVRRPQLGSGKRAKKKFETDKIRHDLWVEDLQRYGISCIEIDEFEEVDHILQEIETSLARRGIFVSGSYPSESGFDEERRYIEIVATGIGKAIAAHGKRLVSGFGLVVGSAVVSGALETIMREEAPNLEKSLLLRPFPQRCPEGMDEEEFRLRYREEMVRQAGICVVIAGTRGTRDVDRVDAPGVLAEVELAEKYGRLIIPIGATGGAAQEIWKKMKGQSDSGKYPWSRKDFDLLNVKAASPDEVVAAFERILKSVG